MASYPLLSQAPTHVEVELGCDNLYYSQETFISIFIFTSIFALSNLMKRKSCNHAEGGGTFPV